MPLPLSQWRACQWLCWECRRGARGAQPAVASGFATRHRQPCHHGVACRRCCARGLQELRQTVCPLLSTDSQGDHCSQVVWFLPWEIQGCVVHVPPMTREAEAGMFLDFAVLAHAGTLILVASFRGSELEVEGSEATAGMMGKHPVGLVVAIGKHQSGAKHPWVN
jgi:hypothetical protein